MKEKLTRIRKYAFHIIAFLCPILIFYLLEWFTHKPFKTMKWTPQLLNIVLFELILLFLFSLIGNLKAALIVQTVFFFVYGLANYFVLDFRSAPIQPWDILSIGTAVSVADNFKYELNTRAWQAVAGFACVFVLAFFCKASFSRKKWKLRLAIFILSTASLFGFTKMLHNETFVQQKLRLYDKLFTPTTIMQKNGTAMAFLMGLKYITVEKPDGYNAADTAAMLEQFSSGTETSETPAPGSTIPEKMPNIIVIMNEAFTDPAVLGEFTTNTDYMPFVHSLLNGTENTQSGFAQVSVKGGNTANTEFEYLTGNTMAFLPQGSIPYQQYIKGELPSIASYLKNLGYSTVAMHPYHAGGWDRDTVYPNLGFEKSYFLPDYKDAEIIRKYVSDKADYEKIIEVYEQKEPGKPLFLFNVTMQNHSSYSEQFDNFKPDITVDNSSSKLLPTYLSLMKLSDEAIEELVNYFAGQDEETLIVFFGDHQPTDSIVNPVLKLHGRTCADLSAEEESLRYSVPFFVWANYDIEEETEVVTSANFLPARTLEAAGLPLPSYFAYLNELEETLPAIAATHVIKSDGTITDASEQKEALSQYQAFQYYLLFDLPKEESR